MVTLPSSYQPHLTKSVASPFLRIPFILKERTRSRYVTLTKKLLAAQGKGIEKVGYPATLNLSPDSLR